MNATQEMWLVIANGQKVMGREMLTLAQQGRSADDVAECVKLANFCAYIETVARRKAFQRDDGEQLKCSVCGAERVAAFRPNAPKGSTGWLVCPNGCGC